MSTRVHLIRHASCDTTGSVLTGWQQGIRLNERGREEAARLQRALAHVRIDAVYSSPIDRALETAMQIAGARGLAIAQAEELGELRFGEWTGREIAALRQDPLWIAFNRFRSATRAPGGDLMLEVQARAVAWTISLREAHRDGAVAAVTHGDVIRAILAHFAGVPLDLVLRVAVDPASVSTLVLWNDWCTIERMNWIPEMPDDG